MRKNVQVNINADVIGVMVAFVVFFAFVSVNFAIAQSKDALCKKYAKSDWAYQCCKTHSLSNFEECFNSKPSNQQKGQSGASKPQQSAAKEPSGLFTTSQGEAAYQAYLGCLQKNDNDVDICDNDPAYNKIKNDTQKKYDECQNACGQDAQCLAGCDKYKKMLGEISQAKVDAGFVTGKPPKHSKPALPHDFTEEFQSLAGGLSRPFDDIYWKARMFPNTFVTDKSGHAPTTWEIQNKGWKNSTPVKTEVPFSDVQSGDVVSTQMPQGLPLGKMVFAAYDPVKYADAEITIYDGKTTPEILRETNGPLGNDDVQTPDPKKYDIGFYFRIGTVVREKDEEIHPFAGAMFEILPWMTFDSPQYIRNLRVIRWDRSQQRWDELPLNQEPGCDYGKGCRVFAKSPGTSYFAVVAEKQNSWLTVLKKAFLWILIIAEAIFWAGIIFLVVWFVRGRRKKRLKNRY